MSKIRRFPSCFVLAIAIAFGGGRIGLLAQAHNGPTTIRSDVHHDVSPPLAEMVRNAKPGEHETEEAEPARRIPLPLGLGPAFHDAVWQQSTSGFSPQLGLSFEGLGNGQYDFWVMYIPPDTNGAVGATQYVQWVNTDFAVFNKQTGALVAGPAPGNALWSGFGGGCEADNDGDPIVVYDKLANRWVMSQFSVSEGPPYLQCIAVSSTSDATGTWNRYAFQYGYFDDYPKMGVWSDAYYESFNMFDMTNGGEFMGSVVCAYNRAAMLSGGSATQICFQQSSAVGGLLPADIDGAMPPPAGSPNYLLTYGANTLELYKFHADFTTPANSSFTGPTEIPVAAFTPLCGGGAECVPQLNTSARLDSLADRLMYRLAYRNFGDHEALVVNHSVAANGAGGIRWYEIQSPGTTPVVAQQGTYAPDTNYRWMGSMAMDHIGDIAVGYSVSSAGMYPSIAFAGRMPSDPLGTLETETSIVTGAGSQTNASRWGDYSAMTVDPVDDCTFWYTQQYLPANGTFNWRTRIANFKFPGCLSGGYIDLYPGQLSFGDQNVGTASSSQAITLSNLEPGSLVISSIAATGDFQQTNNCGTGLATNAQCTISVTFQPTATGLRTGTVTVTDNGPGSPRVANLSGFGTTPVSCTQSVLSNGSFESGTMQCWTAGGALLPQVATAQAEHGSFSALLGATTLPEPNGDSWVYQTVTVPAAMQTPTLTFWYWPWSSDTIEHNWQEAQVRDNSGDLLAEVFKVASNTQTWMQVTYDLSAYKGQTVQLYFNVHEDGYGNPTYMYLDNVSIADLAGSGVQFVPLTPCRVVDTRLANGNFGGPSITGRTSRSFTLPQGGCGIPQSATAYSLNVTAVPHRTLGFLTIWPTGEPQPLVSTMNSNDGRVKANAAIVPAGASGAVSVYVTDTTDVVLDINGYFTSPGANTNQFYPLAPCRVIDTRGPNGALGGPYLAGGGADGNFRSFPVGQSSCLASVPQKTNIAAYSMNFTVQPHYGPLAFLTVWPQGGQQPLVSTLNNDKAKVLANAAIVPAGSPNGGISVFAYQDTDLIADINGYFAAPTAGGLSLYGVQPCRVIDTRLAGGGQPFNGQLSPPVNPSGSTCMAPSDAGGYVFNATVVPQGSLWYLTLWPDSEAQPLVSTLNAGDGSVTSNMAIVPNLDGLIQAYAAGTTQLILDISGYFAE